jgi:hypothetical protein
MEVIALLEQSQQCIWQNEFFHQAKLSPAQAYVGMILNLPKT